MAIDFSAFDTQAIRSVIKAKAACLQAGFKPSHPLIAELEIIKLGYIEYHTLAAYVNHMLGKVTTTPIGDCRLYWSDGGRIPLTFRGDTEQSVERYIVKHFRPEALPFRVETDRWVKYL